MELIWILLGLFVFMTMAYVAIALFYPEWVGINGKVAKEVEKHQMGDVQNSPENNESSK